MGLQKRISFFAAVSWGAIAGHVGIVNDNVVLINRQHVSSGASALFASTVFY